ncbi:MAG: hypothetical protein V4736_15890 [Bdellovibrionota bacterium]
MGARFLAILCFFSSLSSFAAINEKDLAAMVIVSELASKFHLADSFGNLPNKLSMSRADNKIYLRDIEKNKFQNVKLPVFVTEGTKIKTGKGNNTFTIDFKNISKSVITVNNLKMDLSTPLSYGKAKTMINTFFQGRSNVYFNLMIPSAQADIPLTPATIAYAAMITEASAVAETRVQDLRAASIPLESLESTIIGTYEADVVQNLERLAFANSKTSRPTGLYYTTPMFSCSNGKLSEMQRAVLISEGKSVTPGSMQITRTKLNFIPKSGLYVLAHSNCSTYAKPNGDVVPTPSTEKLKACPDTGKTFFRNGPFYEYPRVAMACCAKKGCKERVDRGIAALQAKFPKSEFDKPATGR